MAPVTTHPGGKFYVWYQQTYGYAPPSVIDSNATRYLAWQQGVPQNQAAMIPQGTQGQPAAYFAGVQAAAAAAFELAAEQAAAAAAAASAQLAAQEQAAAAQAAAAAAAAAANAPSAAPTPAPISKGINPGQPGNTIVAVPAPPAPPSNAAGGIVTTNTTATGGEIPGYPLQAGLPAGHALAGIADYSDAASIGQQKAMYNAWKTNSNRNPVVLSALFLIGTAENGWNPNTCNSSNHCGVFQLDSTWQAEHDYRDTQYWAGYAIHQGFYGGYGGLEKIVADHPTWEIGEIVEACQGAGPTWADASAYYQGRASEANGVLVYFEQHYANASLPAPTGSSTPTSTLPSNPTPPGTDQAPVAWGNTHNSGAVDNGYYQLHRTYQVWNPQFRDQLKTLANRPITG